MQRAGVDLEEVALVDGHLVHEVTPAALLHELGELGAVARLLAHDDRGVGVAVEHVPALALAEAAVLVLGGIGVVGVDLDGEVPVGVEDLDEQREAVARGLAEQLVVLAPQRGEAGAGIGPAHDLAIAGRVGADGPALTDGAFGDVIAKDGVQTATAPDLLVEDGLGEDEFLGHFFSLRMGDVRIAPILTPREKPRHARNAPHHTTRLATPRTLVHNPTPRHSSLRVIAAVRVPYLEEAHVSGCGDRPSGRKRRG